MPWTRSPGFNVHPRSFGGGLAFYLYRILKGSKPTEFPASQPTRFDLVINLKAAKTTWPDNSIVPAMPGRQSDLVIRQIYLHAQHALRHGQSLHCHPGFGTNTPISIVRSTSAARWKSRTLAPRSRFVAKFFSGNADHNDAGDDDGAR